MFTFLIFTNLIILFFTIISIFRTYKLKAFLYPGSFFCLLWFCTTLGYYIATSFTNIDVIDENYANELNVFILFTTISFFLVKNYKKRNICNNFPIWNVRLFEKLYLLLSLIVCSFSFYAWFKNGMSFNFLEQRNLSVETTLDLLYGTTERTFLMSFGAFIVFLNPMLAVYAGYSLLKKKTIIELSILFIPFLSSIFQSLSVGGRVAIIMGMFHYIFGIGVYLSGIINEKYGFHLAKKIGLYLIICFGLFSIYSNINLNQRVQGASTDRWSEYPILRPVGSIIEYFCSPYECYQLRRDDYATDKLEYGEKSFGGIIFFELPGAGFLHLKKASMGELLGLKRFSEKEMHTYLFSINARLASGVTSTYLLIYDDFGWIGSFFVIFFIVFLSHLIFVNWFNHNHSTFFSIYFLLLINTFWAFSIFTRPFLSGDVKTYLLGILIIEIIRLFAFNFSKKSQKDFESNACW